MNVQSTPTKPPIPNKANQPPMDNCCNFLIIFSYADVIYRVCGGPQVLSKDQRSSGWALKSGHGVWAGALGTAMPVWSGSGPSTCRAGPVRDCRGSLPSSPSLSISRLARPGTPAAAGPARRAGTADRRRQRLPCPLLPRLLIWPDAGAPHPVYKCCSAPCMDPKLQAHRYAAGRPDK